VRETLRSFFEPPFSADPMRDAAKLAWIIRLRWIALFAQLAAIAPALYLELLELGAVPWFVGVVACMALVNGFSWAALRRGYEPRQRDLLIQLGLDVGGTSILLAARCCSREAYRWRSSRRCSAAWCSSSSSRRSRRAWRKRASRA
jgi:hypothetical protein